MNRPMVLPVAWLCDELGRVVGCDVELVCRGGVWLVVPMDRSQLSAPFWRTVRASPSQGAWAGPEEALVAFSAGAEGWRRAAAVSSAQDPADVVRQALGAGPRAAGEVIAAAAAAGVSHDRLDRAARRLGVRRQKTGMRDGWLWSLPAEDRDTPSDGAEKAAERGAHGQTPNAAKAAQAEDVGDV